MRPKKSLRVSSAAKYYMSEGKGDVEPELSLSP